MILFIDLNHSVKHSGDVNLGWNNLTFIILEIWFTRIINKVQADLDDSYHSKGRHLHVVSIVQLEELATLLIRLVSAVVDLVTPGVDIYTLTIITSELILSTPGHLHRDVVWETIVTSYTEM